MSLQVLFLVLGRVNRADKLTRGDLGLEADGRVDDLADSVDNLINVFVIDELDKAADDVLDGTALGIGETHLFDPLVLNA